MDIILSTEDIEWIKSQYPKLKIDTHNKVIEGELSFTRGYKGYELSDCYTVKILLHNEDISMLPKVYELSNKIVKIAKANKKDMSDLHINPDGSFCLGIAEREQELFKNKFTVEEFFKKSLEPFLFQISYYAKEGCFPWGEYAHGYLGHLETYAENKIDRAKLVSLLQKKDISKVLTSNRQNLCLCGSGKKLRKCHPLVFQGIKKIKKEM